MSVFDALISLLCFCGVLAFVCIVLIGAKSAIKMHDNFLDGTWPKTPDRGDDATNASIDNRDQLAIQVLPAVVLSCELSYAFGKRTEMPTLQEFVVTSRRIADAMAGEPAAKAEAAITSDEACCRTIDLASAMNDDDLGYMADYFKALHENRNTKKGGNA